MTPTQSPSDVYVPMVIRADERARPRTRRADEMLGTNYGGVVIAAAPGVSVKPFDAGSQPTTFEYVAARATSGSSSCAAIVVYRPGSAAVTNAFFAKFADLLNHLATLVDPVVLAGDINIRFERVFDPNVVEFSELLADHGLTRRRCDARRRRYA